MLSLIAILLLLVIPLLMLSLHLTRWRHASQWFLVVVGILLVWPLVLFTHFSPPQSISYISWVPKSLFPLSPALLVDDISWPFSIALVTLGLTLVLTAVARVEQAEPSPEQRPTPSLRDASARITTANWPTWAGSLLIISMGLVAVQPGNLLTILLSWAAIDVIELLVLLAQVSDSAGRERAVIAFSSRAASIGILVLAQIQIWQTGRISHLSSISPQSAIYLLIAAGLRLGVLPLHLPFLQEVPLRRSLGTILRLVPAAAGLSLLVRVATVGIESSIAMYLLVFCAFAAAFGAGLWALAADELAGRPYWILGTASLATASAITGQTDACLAWGIASILSGGLLFFTSLRHPWLRILVVFGFLGLSGLPFTPNWAGVQFYTTLVSSTPSWLSTLFFVGFIAAHALLITGYLRHSLRSTLLAGDNTRNPQVERWIWIIYPVGLAALPITHFLIGFWTMPDYRDIPRAAYFSGLAASALGFGLWYISQQLSSSQITKPVHSINKIPSELLSFAWLYKPIWYLYHQLQRLSALAYALLEGDGGILWAIVLFFFILMFMQR